MARCPTTNASTRPKAESFTSRCSTVFYGAAYSSTLLIVASISHTTQLPDVILRYCHSRDLCVTEAQLPAGDHATVLYNTQLCARPRWALAAHYSFLQHPPHPQLPLKWCQATIAGA